MLDLASAQFAAQDFADIRFGQFVAEFYIAGDCVACELGAAVGDELVGCERAVFFYDKQFQRFACFVAFYADAGGF